MTTIGIIAIVIIASISGTGTIITALALRRAMMNNKELVSQIEQIGYSLGGVVERIEGIGRAFETISTRNEQIAQTFDSVITRAEQTNRNVEKLAERNEQTIRTNEQTIRTLENITARSEDVGQTLNNVVERLEQTNGTLDKVAGHNEKTGQLLEDIAERNEQISQTLDSVVKRSERTSRVLERIVESNQEMVYKLDNIITRNEQTGRTSARIAERHEDISRALTVLEKRIELLSYRDELSAPGWQTKLRACQRQAARHEPAYVKAKKNDPTQYLLTKAGRAFLPADLKKEINGILREDGSIEDNELILSLGLPYLFETSQQKQAEFDVFLGVITSFADEIRNKT